MLITKTVQNGSESPFECTMKAGECDACKGMFHPFDLTYYSYEQYSLCDTCRIAQNLPEGE